MRKGVIWALLAIAAGMVLPAKSRDGKQRLDAPQPRRAGAQAASVAFAPPTAIARIASLWEDRAGVQCRVPTMWAAELAPRAAFAPVLRLRLRAAHKAAAADAGGWIAQEQLLLAVANDADIASSLAQAGGAVRVLKGATFKPRRALLGAHEAQLAA